MQQIISVVIDSIPSIEEYLTSMKLPTITATFADGTTEKLFEFYPDELSFTPEEFIGLSESEAHALYRTKDIEYIQSK